MKTHSLAHFPIITIGLVLLSASAAQAQSFSFAPIDFPNAIRTRAWGINPGGVIVGDYRDASGTSHGFLLSGGHYLTVDVPGTLIGLTGTLPTALRGISPSGDIVGIYFAPPGSSADCTLAGSPPCIKGFSLHQGRFSTVLFPGHPGSIPQRITPVGNIYGCYHDFDLMGSMFGFARTASGFTSIDVPASMHTGATPDGNTIVGLYTDMAGVTHGYVLRDGNFHSFDVPSSTFTQAWDVNPAANIVGDFQDSTGMFRGFLRTAGHYTPIDFPAAVATHSWGINPGGAIVGTYTDTNGVTHGYLAIPFASN